MGYVTNVPELQSCNSLSRDNDSCIVQMQISSHRHYNCGKAAQKLQCCISRLFRPYATLLELYVVAFQGVEGAVLRGMLGHKEH
jgi:hypothetical protein